MEKLAKTQVQYEHPAQGMDECRDCQHFVEPQACEIVVGVIKPEDWCDLFLAVEVDMPAKSKAQQQAMAIAEHAPGKLYKRNKGLLNMTHEQLHDFAATKSKKLPERASGKGRKKFSI